MEKRKKGERTNRNTLIIWGWIAISYLWLWKTGVWGCPPAYPPIYSGTVDYSDLLRRNSLPELNLLTNPPITLGVVFLLGILLMIKTRSRLVAIFLISLVPLTCVMYFMAMMATFCNFTVVEHVDTVAFDGATYQLAVEYDYNWDPGYFETDVYLFRCDVDGNQCNARAITSYFEKTAEDLELRLEIDTARNDLFITGVNGRIFSVDDR